MNEGLAKPGETVKISSSCLTVFLSEVRDATVSKTFLTKNKILIFDVIICHASTFSASESDSTCLSLPTRVHVGTLSTLAS